MTRRIENCPILSMIGLDDPAKVFNLPEGESFETSKGYKIISFGCINTMDGDNFRTVLIDAVLDGDENNSFYSLQLTWNKIWSDGEGCGETDHDWELQDLMG